MMTNEAGSGSSIFNFDQWFVLLQLWSHACSLPAFLPFPTLPRRVRHRLEESLLVWSRVLSGHIFNFNWPGDDALRVVRPAGSGNNFQNAVMQDL